MAASASQAPQPASSSPPAAPPSSTPPAKVVGVIDIGASSVRLVIAQIRSVDDIQILDTLHQGVSLGRDTFASGTISRATTEDCVEAIRKFQKVFAEYQPAEPGRIRAVATSAVREAVNREPFLDRIFVATGIAVQVLEEADVIRLMYVAVLPFLRTNPELMKGDTIVVEVGAGSTELILLHDGAITFSGTFRIGALRMREMLEEREGPGERLKELLETNIQRPVMQLRKTVPVETEPRIVAIGGDARLAVGFLQKERDKAVLSRLRVPALASLAEELMSSSVDAVAKKFKVTFVEAQTLGPALQTYMHLAKAFRLKELLVPETSLRDGLIHEMASGHAWNEEFRDQIIQSAIELGRKYQFDEAHGRHVATLAVTLFESLAAEHRLGPQHLLILRLAAILHEIGLFVSTRSHHKHSMYLILNSEIFGLDRRTIEIIALIARYHRRAGPRPDHEVYMTLDRESRVVVAKLAAILRVADTLDRSHSQRIAAPRCSIGDGRFVIGIPGVRDIALEQLALNQKGQMFEAVYGLTPILRRVAS